MNDEQAKDVLRARGADPALLERIAQSGLSVAVASATGVLGRLWRPLRPEAPLSSEERQRLQAVAELAADVADMEQGADGARRFWNGPMPWLSGRTPAQALAHRGGLGVIDDLLNRLKYGIYP